MSSYPVVALRRAAAVTMGTLRHEQDDRSVGDVPIYGANGIIGFGSESNIAVPVVAVGRVGALCGNVHVVSTPAWVTENALIVQPLGDNRLRFLHYALSTSRISEQTQSTAIPMLTQEMLRSVVVRLPPPVDQATIADFLDRETTRIDAIIAAKRRMIGLLVERLTELERTQILEGWSDRVPLRWCATVNSGYSIPAGEVGDSPGVPVIGGNGVMGYTSREAFVNEPAIAVGRVGALCGNVHVVSVPSWVTDNALLVRPTGEFEVEFLAVALRASDLNSLADKTAQPLITGETVKSLRVPCPPQQVQRRAVSEVEHHRTQVGLIRGCLSRQIELLAERRQALITAAVTGELDIQGVAA